MHLEEKDEMGLENALSDMWGLESIVQKKKNKAKRSIIWVESSKVLLKWWEIGLENVLSEMVEGSKAH